ncbi:beta-ketoacyl-ACP synthase [Chiayiivirga flava]|uniref:3-oxoacyl-[acyl-carrier-protein] synthase-1 n=1 Tax=Chiayiivirga flava TaxID=659595 RepID=A0A7W8D2H3_9GAMM|nr:beta-ketoacyl-ACP synthase [Chiayiivirga flava]MBB5206770.1 3-oxoacyl-[acyl-carrier-protein] synthase-1 [Chiayiivirga flava]
MTGEVFLHAPGTVSALGHDASRFRAALFAADAPRGLCESDRYSPGRTLALGLVEEPLPDMRDRERVWRSRNNALLRMAYAQVRAQADAAIERFGAARVAVIVGTSTSGIGESERANAFHRAHGRWPDEFHYGQQEIGAPSAYVAHESGARGPAYTVSTACSSGAKAMIAGARLLRAGIADAVICGGADSLCRFTVAGFSALESVAAGRCNPMSRHRNGINIGEGAALFVMTREPAPVRLAGWGESSDAHHMSAPDPDATGAIAAIAQALARAGIDASGLDYVNLHATATPLNDAMESRALAASGIRAPCSGTKPLTGHTLGAAGAIEAAICWATLAGNPHGALPPHWWDGAADPALPSLHLVAPGERAARAPRHALSLSFAFGGSNAALLLAAA